MSSSRPPAPDERVIRRLASREVYRNRWMRVREDDVVFPDGRRGIFGVVDKPEFAVVLPYENDGFWLVSQYRYPVQSRQWEFPLGAFPEGETGTLAQLARRELAEETGLHCVHLTLLGHLLSAPGVQSNGFDVYLATELTPSAPDREPSESDMVHEWRSVDELTAMIARGEFADAASLAALALFLLRDRG